MGRVIIKALMPDELQGEGGELDRRREELKRVMSGELLGQVRGDGEHKVGPRNYQRRDKEVGNSENDPTTASDGREGAVDEGAGVAKRCDEYMGKAAVAVEREVFGPGEVGMSPPSNAGKTIADQRTLAEARLPLDSRGHEQIELAPLEVLHRPANIDASDVEVDVRRLPGKLPEQGRQETNAHIVANHHPKGPGILGRIPAHLAANNPL